MLEFQKVPDIDFTNPDGDVTPIKFRYEWNPNLQTRKVSTNNRDLDLVAFDELGHEAEALRVLEYNATAISEYDFDLTKVPYLNIPIR